ncbi:uncharacterized protein METZ01_LOCUS324439 [marine metagenome]|uniref:Uncharacterized protein n=1 Tax=marine metagenome TaxID=408172 RepID=A0A382PG35_9ZZZZ
MLKIFFNATVICDSSAFAIVGVATPPIRTVAVNAIAVFFIMVFLLC